MSTENRGIILANLGSPSSLTFTAVAAYLRQFLMDKRVLDLPWPLRCALVYGVILPFRTPRSLLVYRAVWREDGSPLVVYTRRAAAKLASAVGLPVEAGMRYGSPSLKEAFLNLCAKGGRRPEEILLIPLFPQYAIATYETVVVEAQRIHRRVAPTAALYAMPPFYAQEEYIEALSEVLSPYLGRGYDHVLFSFHGLPLRHLLKADPTGTHCLRTPDCCRTPSLAHATCYRMQALTTAERVAERCTIPPERFSVAFQSRFSREKWLAPATEEQLATLPLRGIRNLIVLCPSFVTDCLETLEEIGLRGRNIFLTAGGKKFTVVPCLNDHARWIRALECFCLLSRDRLRRLSQEDRL